jgi:lipopolysaccharide export system protein LptA
MPSSAKVVPAHAPAGARRGRFIFLAALIGLAWLGLGAAARAERADRDQPVHIEADSAHMDDLKRIAVYEGKVVLTQGTLWLSAERIEIHQDENGIKSGTATGNPVQFHQKVEGKDEWVEGQAAQVDYDAHSDLVTLIGGAHLKKGDEELRGEYITYNDRTELFQARGGMHGQKQGRVHAVILPRKEQTPSKTPAPAKAQAPAKP